MSLYDAANLSGGQPSLSDILAKVEDSHEIATRKYCIEVAMSLGERPKDAGELIRKAAGIYSWLMSAKKVTTDE